MTRVPNHLIHLNKVFNDNRRRPLAYGTWDCCIFAADAVLATTGIDHLALFRGQYDTLIDGLKLLKVQGEGTILKTVIKMLGDPISSTKAWRGDIVYHRRNLGVCAGSMAYFITDEGLSPFPMNEMKRTFAVR